MDSFEKVESPSRASGLEHEFERDMESNETRKDKNVDRRRVGSYGDWATWRTAQTRANWSALCSYEQLSGQLPILSFHMHFRSILNRHILGRNRRLVKRLLSLDQL